MNYPPVDRLHASFVKCFALVTAAVMLFALFGIINPAQVRAAACTAPTTDYGSTTMTVNIATAGTYRIWSRIMAPDANNNSYLLEVDGTTCYTVGDSAITANEWKWVDYQGGNSAAKTDLNLTAGVHNLRAIGREANVKLDRILLVSDLGCTPSGIGDNCASAGDITQPKVDITAPADGATVSGSSTVSATATDETGGSGMAKVEFYDNGVLKSTDTSSPFSYSWNTSSVTNGSHTLLAKAYDNAQNSASDSIAVNVQNNDTQAPSTPANLTTKAASATKVTLSWTASTDNTGVTGYNIQRNGAPLAKVGKVATYDDTTAAPNTTYSYRLTAFDAAGNESALSSSSSVTTPNTADTQAPTVPTNISAAAVSASQINLSWTASTDNVKVTSYDVYRAKGNDSATKVATVATPGYGDTNLSASTKYSYYIIAHDGAANSSEKSATASATTSAVPAPPPPTKKHGNLKGRVIGKNDKPIKPHGHVILQVDGFKHIYDTGRDGRYRLQDLPAGTYTVKYQGPGYVTQRISVEVAAGKTTTKNVKLQPR